MNNINPAPLQQSFSESLVSPNLNVPPSVVKEQPTFSQTKLNSAGGSNKLWIILLILLAMIVGFWIGYFTHEYFFRNQGFEDQLGIVEPVNEVNFEPVSEPLLEPEEELTQLQSDYIIFRDETININDGLNFISQEQCVEDETALLTDIGEDYVNLQINQWRWDEELQETVADLIDFQVRDQECLGVRPICPGLTIDRCFTLANVDGVFYLDYNFREEGAMLLPE